MNSAIKQMKAALQKACDDYMKTYCEREGIDPRSAWWVADDPTGTAMLLDGELSLTLSELTYAVEQGIKWQELSAWKDYCLRCSEFNLPTLNLRSWHEGAPQIPDSKLTALETLKQELDTLAKEIRDEY